MKAQSMKVTAVSAALAAGLALVAAACGTSAASPADGGHVAAAPAAGAKLQVLENIPGGQARRWSLRCDPVGGTMPDATAACRLLATDATILRPARATHIMCKKVMAARTFTITGTWHATKVHEVVADGGCDLRRWSEMAQIFY
jgi:hypothetical protein